MVKGGIGMQAKLVVVAGAKPATLSLKLPAIVGRSRESNVKVKHHHISRSHCEIFEIDGELAVRDLGSANGTFVNGQRIDEPVLLGEGDELTIGSVTFEAVYDPRRCDAARGAEPAPIDSAGESAVLQYTEAEDGSFVSIDFAGEPPPQASSIPIVCDPLQVDDVSQVRIRTQANPAAQVSQDDDGLQDFLRSTDGNR